MTIAIDLNGDPAFDLDIQARGTLHGRVEWKPATNEYRVVKADGTKVAISGTQTRPKNRCLSNIGLDDPQSPAANSPQCLWDNAAFEPAIERIAPPSFTGNAVASWRLFDDADRCWWVVVEAVSDQLVVWLHRPATIFLQAMQPLQENCRELHRFYLPEHLVGERVHVATSPRGNKAILQVITDKADLPLDSAAGAAPERYTLPWAQFVRVLDFTGTGSWSELPDDPDWGVGIESDASLYVSPYSAGTGTLSTHRKLYEFVWKVSGASLERSGIAEGPYEGDTYKWWNYSATFVLVMEPRALDDRRHIYRSHIDLELEESVSAPLVVFFNDQGELVEVTLQVSISERHKPYVDAVSEGYLYKYQHPGGPVVEEPGRDPDTAVGTSGVHRSGVFSVRVSVNSVERLSVHYDIDTSADSPSRYSVNGREYNLGEKNLFFFVVQIDSGSVSVFFGCSDPLYFTRRIMFYLVLGIDDYFGRGHFQEGSYPDDTVYLNHDGAGRRFDEPLPAQYNGVDAGDGSDKRDVSHYICHYVMGRGQDGYIQRGLVHQWEDFDAWMVLGYC